MSLEHNRKAGERADALLTPVSSFSGSHPNVTGLLPVRL